MVDDQMENIWPLVEHLENEYEIFTATSGQQALDLVFSEEMPDLILLDIVMPGMDGYEVCERLKADEFSRDIPIVFLTEKSHEQEETKGLELGGHDYITKPFSLKVVQARIKAILGLKQEMKRRLSPKTILVVDDNPDNIHILVETLEAEYTVKFATNGQDALELAFSADPPDLILLDIMMPGMDGYEVCARLKANADTREIPIIFVTAMNQELNETKGLQLGAVDFVSKPFRISVVEARVKSALLLKDAMDKRLELTSRLEDLNRSLEKRIKVRTEELEQAYKEKDELTNQLRQAQKMESIGTLAGGIAHDFNNILSAISGYSELAKLKLPDDSKAVKHIDQVLQASNRAQQLVRQILTFSRQTEQEMQPLEIRLVVKEALKLLRASIPTTIKISEHLDGQNGMVQADSTQIHQIIMNLCTNAYQAMQETGGILDVRLERIAIKQNDRRVMVLSFSPGPYILLNITDSGPGMSSITQERIFEPYFTTKAKGKGTGLGLAVVHGIVKDHGGHIMVESELGKGTSFQVYLPEIT